MDALPSLKRYTYLWDIVKPPVGSFCNIQYNSQLYGNILEISSAKWRIYYFFREKIGMKALKPAGFPVRACDPQVARWRPSLGEVD
jgi:hypothetical protein